MTERKRLVGDRFRRIWAIAEEIAARPGQTRLDLARHFHLSERQVQADLNIIRVDMRLPLVRDRGYRFQDEGGALSGPTSLQVRDALVMAALLTRGRADRTAPREDVDALSTKLPEMFPPHLRPLATRAIRHDRSDAAFLALTDALLRGASVRLDFPEGAGRKCSHEPVVTPELLVPYLGSWLLIGKSNGLPARVFPMDGIRAVTFASAGRA